MAKAIKGNPAIDAEVQKLLINLRETVTDKNARNSEKVMLKKLKRTLTEKLAIVDYYLIERVEQSIGGVASSVHVLKKRLNVRDDA